MSRYVYKPASLLLIFCLASACGDIRGALEFIDQREQYTDRRNALLDRSNSAFVAIPDTGTGTFRGEATMSAGNVDDGVTIIGDATLNVDYETGDVTANMNNFGGFDRTNEYSDYSGSLVFEDGAIGTNRPNDVQGQIVGTLNGEDYEIEVDAQWEGDFRGTPVVGILGSTGMTQTSIELNGEPVPGGIVIAVTN